MSKRKVLCPKIGKGADFEYVGFIGDGYKFSSSWLFGFAFISVFILYFPTFVIP